MNENLIWYRFHIG